MKLDGVTFLETIIDVNKRAYRFNGIGGWRKIYLGLIDNTNIESIAEFGCGDPAFLERVNAKRKIAFDCNDSLKGMYKERNIELTIADFNADNLPQVKAVDVAVCSDVFEHLLYPEKLLSGIKGILKSDGMLFSHVPNEFRLLINLKIMSGCKTTVNAHPDTDEWNDPHLRRFTDIGYKKFLSREFKYNIQIAHLRYNAEKIAYRLGVKVPFCVAGGPTYLSTNDAARYEEMKKIIAGI